ncbi:hypothetical protein POSPLADRAFT_1045965 [Postia placenta MAD-698-R-SB12]|uniref:Uncharacterized protein n=1 Tax=Postia placenta MAD-698-R-SB12 TaxID=670580 RepID=A0A1X6N561_9APHY|nr:hypothetical protein POSPLADRAFT_1045965 [Postia placenta MAD-698-R-SB12]OSX63748.1 hypothetical protein POSPLADRAFT_1045965 [Postia placenta MAD-698-R-SB12]
MSQGGMYIPQSSGDRNVYNQGRLDPTQNLASYPTLSVSPPGSSLQTPRPEAGARTPSASSGAVPNVLGSLKQFLPGDNVSALFDPPPPSFQRPPRPDLPYAPFAPTPLMTAGSELDKGFPLIAPPSTTVPHPFVTHGVGEEDWLRFLNDAKTASKLSPVDRVKSTVAPMAMHMSIGIGYLVSKAIMKRQKDKKRPPSATGTLSYSGPDVPPPDMAHLPPQDHHYDTDSDSASDSDVNGSSNSPESSRVATRGGRRERRMERRAERGQRMGRRREKRSQAKEQWRLIVWTFGDEYTLEALSKIFRPSSALSAKSQSEECGPCDTTYVRNQT